MSMVYSVGVLIFSPFLVFIFIFFVFISFFFFGYAGLDRLLKPHIGEGP